MRNKGEISVALDPNPRTAARPGRLAPKRPVAGYLRSATQLEGDTLHEQLDAIVRFARDRDMQLIRIYCDECGRGLWVDDRTGLPQMFCDIESGSGEFDAVLLLDPSRWGRFQDPDQCACLEYACGTAGIEVHYCAEDLFDDDTPTSTIVKAIKRSMVGEYSRELSDAVWRRAGPSKKRIAAGKVKNAVSCPAGRNGVPHDSSGGGDPRSVTD